MVVGEPAVAHSTEIYFCINWCYSFKWEQIEGKYEYSEKANDLINLIEDIGFDDDGIEETGNGGTVIYVSCSTDEINQIINALNTNGFRDWHHYTYIDENNQDHHVLNQQIVQC
jgi:hypothetical protein